VAAPAQQHPVDAAADQRPEPTASASG
jgi:hypothetical protein